MSTSPLTKLAIIAGLGLGGVALAATTGNLAPNPSVKAGQKFGPLVLRESRGKSEGGKTMWLTQCERCGHEEVRAVEPLIQTQRAGGKHRCKACDRPGPKKAHAPFAGMRIGKFKLVKQKDKDQWVVRCDCGAQETRDIRNLQLSASLHSVPQCRDCKIKKLQTRKPSGTVERDILRAIEGTPKGATAIARETKMGTSTVWNALMRMKKRGWVEYDAHRGATSAATASLTDAGERHLNGSA